MILQKRKPTTDYDNSLAASSDAPASLHFRHFEVRGRHVIADGEYLHELQGEISENDGGQYDAALV